jgi:hypothetical protein
MYGLLSKRGRKDCPQNQSKQKHHMKTYPPIQPLLHFSSTHTLRYRGRIFVGWYKTSVLKINNRQNKLSEFRLSADKLQYSNVVSRGHYLAD